MEALAFCAAGESMFVAGELAAHGRHRCNVESDPWRRVQRELGLGHDLTHGPKLELVVVLADDVVGEASFVRGGGWMTRCIEA